MSTGLSAAVAKDADPAFVWLAPGGGAWVVAPAAQGTPGTAEIVAWAEESRAWVAAPCDSVAGRPLNGLAAENEPRAVRDGVYRHGP